MVDLSAGEFARIVHGQLKLASMPPIGGVYEPVRHVRVDTRDVTEGDIVFVSSQHAWPDTQIPEEAYALGAVGVIAERHVEPWAGRFSIRVTSTSAALWELATWCRRQFHGKVIAMCEVKNGNSKGHDIVNCVLNAQLIGCTNRCDFDSSIGTPLSLLCLDPSDDYALIPFDVESDAYGCLANLCRPDAMVVSRPWYERSWNDFFSHIAAKELMRNMPEDGCVVAPRNDANGNSFTHPKLVRIGTDPSSELVPESITTADDMISFVVDRHHVRLQGDQADLEASLAAIALARWLKIDDAQIFAKLRVNEN